ncbi:response regulator [Lysobacter enzymogenes]|uniref:response regulator n=1 Tax=Lysobacter enzymogenes TaxID=69 RepID=UPI001AF940CC|nr:response regulator transcription factor [Lysobacter enzymogenes]QQQ00602.1 response regulator transcription factor [Lysobacter enzymogenes]
MPPKSSDAVAAAQPRLLLVDDDADILALLVRYLGANGCKTATAASAAQARATVAAGGIDLVLLDLGLPDEDGLSLLRHLQTQWRGPVIVVSGRGEAVDRVVGLELGADDYVAKPFDLRELLARVRSVLRRAAAPAPAAECLAFEGFRLDLSARRLTDATGAEIALTTGEFQLLRALLQRPQQVLSRDELMTALHGREAGPYDRTIDVAIGRLRRKIEADPAAPGLIKAVRGAGYLFAAAVSAR